MDFGNDSCKCLHVLISLSFKIFVCGLKGNGFDLTVYADKPFGVAVLGGVAANLLGGETSEVFAGASADEAGAGDDVENLFTGFTNIAALDFPAVLAAFLSAAM